MFTAGDISRNKRRMVPTNSAYFSFCEEVSTNKLNVSVLGLVESLRTVENGLMVVCSVRNLLLLLAS